MFDELEFSRRAILRIGASSACLFGLGLVNTRIGDIFGPTIAWADAPLYAPNDFSEGTYTPESALIEGDHFGDGAVAAATTLSVLELKGATRYETAAKEALQAYPSSSSVIIASGGSYADSIAVGGLAGALSCPILLTGRDSLPAPTENALAAMRANSIIVLGGTDVISSAVENKLKSYGSVTRLAGPTRFETQMKIFEYGAARGYWTGDTAIVATGNNFADALAISPVAFALKAPVFFCGGGGNLPKSQKDCISTTPAIKRVLLAGGPAVISNDTESYLRAIGKEVVRLGGELRYQTSLAIANYAVSNLGFTWDGVAFTSGGAPYDALAGSPLQGKDRAPLLLVNDGCLQATVNMGRPSSCIKFFGGYSAVSIPTRVAICTKLGVPSYGKVKVSWHNISLSTMANLEAKGAGANGITYDQFLQMLDPNAYSYGTAEYFQFAVLTGGYSGLSAGQLDSYVSNNCTYSESVYGRKSSLRSMGSAFIEAARTYGVNEAYLLAHAIFESAWGCSDLAGGWTPDKDGTVVVNGKSYPYRKGTTYYNFYGIGAVDSNALSAGRAMAVKQGWTSPKLAILGAAKWISDNYLRRSSGPQHTLYLMKFDVAGAAKGNGIWHQYCTGGNTWVLGIARVMYNNYLHAGKSFDSSGVSFDVPSYNG